MRLAPWGSPGNERPVVSVDDGRWFDLRSVTADIAPAFLADGGWGRAAATVATGDLTELPPPARRGPPIARPGKIVCDGLNYRDHAAETATDVPTLFLKAADTIVGPHDQATIPWDSVKADCEVKLAVVIGATAHYEPADRNPLRYVAGYTSSNDISEREFQLPERSGQWDKGKNGETSNPLRPWLQHPADVPAPQALDLALHVNQTGRQAGTTADMIFSVADLVAYIPRLIVLYPGDIINTGTPAGVALAGHAPYLAAGDVTRLSIEGLGLQEQTFVVAQP
jgi:2-keto-4-pentenoate hydratase/2-oxohepta-3-ene-1,7-dioic acid hydratase in catechol pathway